MTEPKISIERPPGKPQGANRRYKVVLAVVACLLVAGFLVWLWCYLRPDTWRYYTDEITTRQLAKHVDPQLVVWEKAELSPGDANMPSEMSDPAFSPDGARLVFTRGRSEGDANLYMVRWNGLAWGEPQPLRALNSKFNEISPAFSGDGQFLYFSTDRPGGCGGYDIWVSRWDGAEFAWPVPLTLMVNSRFDEIGPAPSPGGDKLYFSSNRPQHELSDEEAALGNRELHERFKHLDHDIFETHRIPAGTGNWEVERATSMLYSLRAAALADADVMVKLGGSAESERAVDKALAWLAANQEAGGVWSITTFGGLAGHDVASTAFALLTFAGRSELHDRPCTYREAVSRGLAWLLEQQNTLTGDLRGQKPPSNGMYDHAIATLALAEIYGLTKDEDLLGPAQDAINFLVDAQNAEDGGWRYTPNSPGDMSVSGWAIMALKSAEMSGLHVPGQTFEGVTRWLASVGGGKQGGIYSYTRDGRNAGPAMVATGYFCSQLMGLSPNTPRSFETVGHLTGKNVSVEDVYYAYYGTLCAYQSQGPFWRQWNGNLHKALLAAQQEDGSWTPSGSHAAAMGRGIVTSLVALSLQAHYRYTPLYGLGYEPPADRAPVPAANLADLPEAPSYQRARRMPGMNSPGQDLHPTVTGHGDFLYFASDRAGGLGGLDIYRSRISGEEPTPPVNLGPAVNSEADEAAPALRMGGFNLLFASNRGQTDQNLYLWHCSISRRVFKRHGYYTDDMSIRLDAAGADVRLVVWEAPYPTLGSFNVPTRSIAPQFLADGASMIFEQDLPETTEVDRVISRWDGRRWSDPEAYMPPGDEAESVSLPFRNGSYVYSAADEKDSLGGLDIYRTRRLDGEDMRKENLGFQINSPADDRLPQTRWEGFDLLFASNRGQDMPGNSLLYSSTAREVVSRLDLSRWYQFKSLFKRIRWWILGGIAALALIVYLLRHWRNLTSLFHRCLVASAIFHLIIALLMSVWFISTEILESSEPKSMEIAIDADALAKEKLALDMQDDVAELPATDVSVAIEQPRDAVPMPEFTPPKRLEGPPIPTRSSDVSFVTKVTPSRASEDVTASLAVAVARMPEVKMPALEIPAMKVEMEEPAPAEPDKAPAPSDPQEMAVQFKPSDIQEDVEIKPEKPRRTETSPVNRPVEDADELADALATAVAVGPTLGATTDTGGTLVVPSAGIESRGALPKLAGKGDLATLLVKSPLPGGELKIDAPGKLDVPDSYGKDVSPAVLDNPGRLSTEIIKDLGGSAETQAAIGRALDWFSKQQEPDGRWDIQKHGGQPGHDVAATSLILLCYYGWGAKHTEAGQYQNTVEKALDWLLDAMGRDPAGNPNGDYFSRSGSNGMYDQGMATIVLCEAYGLTKDKRLLAPASKAVEFIVAAQDAKTGGWRYSPRSGSDTSVFGWQYMALRSAEMAGLPVSKEIFGIADTWLDKVAGGPHGGIYGYDKPGGKQGAMIATGMFSRQLAKVPPDDPRMGEGARFMQVNPINAKNVDWYYLYYGTLALYQHQGQIWEEWNTRMKDTLTALQHRTGEHAGSWDPSGSHGGSMGRAVVTALGTLSLEVYYRILPIYGFRTAEEE